MLCLSMRPPLLEASICTKEKHLFRGLEMVDIIVQAVLPMGTEVEHLQVLY